MPSHRFSLKGEPVEFAANVLAKCLKGIWSSRNGKEPVVPEEYPSYTANKLAKSYFAGARQGPDRPNVNFTHFIQKTPRCSPSLSFPSEADKIQAQEPSAAGDLATVKRVIHDWKGNMKGFSDSLLAAINNGHMAVASYLLEYGSPVEN
ncbi:MAG: hypothetical protein Q9198_007546 [Flavoplaca austrocitrina]